jgi:hypothetical protein
VVTSKETQCEASDWAEAVLALRLAAGIILILVGFVTLVEWRTEV